MTWLIRALVWLFLSLLSLELLGAGGELNLCWERERNRSKSGTGGELDRARGGTRAFKDGSRPFRGAPELTTPNSFQGPVTLEAERRMAMDDFVANAFAGKVNSHDR
jgi:hypothetical protein